MNNLSVGTVYPSLETSVTQNKGSEDDGQRGVKRKFDYIYDQYTEARGEPKMLEVTCAKCHAWVVDYQKDGPGRLLRMYLDRIYHPKALRERIFTATTVKSATELKCHRCKRVLARPIIYQRKFPEPETRPAYLILNDRRVPMVEYQERRK